MHTLEYLCFWKGNVVGLLCVRLPGRGEPVLPPLHQTVRQYDQLCRVLQPQRGERRLRPELAQPLRRPLLLNSGHNSKRKPESSSLTLQAVPQSRQTYRALHLSVPAVLAQFRTVYRDREGVVVDSREYSVDLNTGTTIGSAVRPVKMCVTLDL